MIADIPSSSGQVPSLQVAYGTRCACMDGGGFKITERGMRFKSRWDFPVGTELQVELAIEGADDAPGDDANSVEVSGVVVDCELVPESCGCYTVTLLFLDLPVTARCGLRDVSRKISARFLH